MLVAFAAAPPVSYSRDVAPILALHCSSCHGDAGGLSTRSYGDLMKGGNLGPVIIPGEPGRSLLVHFIDGRRGEAHRMPLGGRRLSTEQIGVITHWIAEGAKADPDTTRAYNIALPRVTVNRGHTLRISCRMPTRAYLTIAVVDPRSKRTLWTDVACVKSPKDPSDAGAPGDLISWDVRPASGWPDAVAIELTIRYAEGEPKPTEFSASLIDSPGAPP